MKRVMVVGGPGAGKTTLAVELGLITGLPVTHMDSIHYLPGWVERSKEQKQKLANEIEAGSRWIFEGGLSATYANRCARADTVIWLDLPLTQRFGRIWKRRVHFHKTTRPEMPKNCTERLSPDFLAYMYRSRNAARQRIAQAITDAPHLKVHHLRTADGARTFLDWMRLEH